MIDCSVAIGLKGAKMVDLAIVGSLALDTVRTPFGSVKRVLGGSASYASYAASFFAKPGVVGVVGSDFPEEHIKLLSSRGIDLAGLERSKGKTFYWEGYYEYDMNEAHTVKTELNSFEGFRPKIPEEYKACDFLFLGNIHPELQLNVLAQMKKRPKLVVADTMNYWIEREREKLLKLVYDADIVLFNEAEARQLFRTTNLVAAAKEILSLNSEVAIIKKGENGCVLFTDDKYFALPGYPLEVVRDPTGSGDCFAGALVGYLSKNPGIKEKNIRKAMVYASSVASYNAEDFSLRRLQTLTMEDINKRFGEFKEMVYF